MATLSVGGRAVQDSDEVASAIAARRPGDRVKIEYYRGDDKRSTTVELTERPDSADAPAGEGDEDGGGGLFP